MRALLREALDGLVAVTIAPACAACRGFLDHPASGVVCRACWAAIPLFSPPLCACCGDPVGRCTPPLEEASSSDGLCSRCLASRPVIAASRAIGPHEGALRDIVHALKYEGRRSVARGLAHLMRLHGADVISGADVAVPVPLHPSRRRQRGFNQAEDLARGLGLPVERLLRRVRRTAAQAELPADERRANVLGAFVCPARRGWPGRSGVACLAGRTILLVDDVATTGATLEACARVLARAGARRVRAVTAARALAPGP